MRLAFISTILGYPWGGADVLWARAAALAHSGGLPLLLAVNPQVATHPRVSSLVAAGAGLHVRHAHTQQRGGRERLRQRVGRLLRRPDSLAHALDRFAPDHVVICQGGSFDFLVEDGLIAWLRETGTAYSLLAQAGDASFALDPAARLTAQAVLTEARAVIFVSRHNREHAARQAGLPLARAAVVPNPVELDYSDPPAWPAAPAPRLAVVARLDRDAKGLDLLLPALARVRTLDWQAALFGHGPDAAWLRDEIAAQGLSGRVELAGHEPDVRRIWSHHHLLVLASRREGCPLAMLEAMACGRPVLMPDVGGASDWIEPGRNGYICAPGAVDPLANALAHALGEPARWPALGAAARAQILARLPRAPEAEILRLVTGAPFAPRCVGPAASAL